MRVPENLIAEKALELAAGGRGEIFGKPGQEGECNRGTADLEELPRQAFVSYYLLEPDGIKELLHALKVCSAPRYLPEIGLLRRATGTYFTALTGLFAAALLGFAAWIGVNKSLTAAQWILIIIALLLPASEWAVTAAHWLIGCVRQPRPLLRYDFSRGVPPEATTMVVIPVIWSSVKEVEEMVARLELHYLANRDSNIHFALLGDFVDLPSCAESRLVSCEPPCTKTMSTPDLMQLARSRQKASRSMPLPPPTLTTIMLSPPLCEREWGKET
jgi:hypothetical protein